MKIFFAVPACLIFFCSAALAQNDFARIDSHVAGLGDLKELNLARIADTITLTFSSKRDKARAIYYWIANQIALDPKAIRAHDNGKSDPETVIASRKTTPMGFARLYQEMASQSNIRCLTVDGYTKTSQDDIGEKPDELNHTWNVVQLGQSPTEWYYVDVAKASGHVDAKGTNFIRQFTSSYFFPDKKLFNIDHFPDNKSWQLGPGPKNQDEFFDIPVIGPAAYDLNMRMHEPLDGKIKAKVNRAFTFKMQVSPDASLESMEMMTGNAGKRTALQKLSFSNEGGVVECSCIFYDEDEFPLSIMANGKLLVTYLMTVTE